ncbi:MAG: hypothetical protein PHW76_04780 [Alphaproteobacteria bacterium]|nr:hypothetical protein [Alphaproteobacteria bacterium]
MRKVLNRLYDRLAEIACRESWMIGVIDEPITNAINWKKCPPVRWLSGRSSKRYLADPFAWPGSCDTVFCEEYDYKTKIGSIKRLKIKNDRIIFENAETFPLKGHLSFPFLFEREGTVYALPESSAARELALFKWEPISNEWVKIASPLEGAATADSILFEHGGLFWIAYTEVSDVHPAHDNLNLLYSTTFEGPWQPHKANPVIRGSSCSRCGGTPFYIDGVLYRPAQDCSRCYGGALRLMRVLECSPESYREEEASFLSPTDFQNPDGLHTLSAWGDRCLVDGKRHVFSPMEVLRKLSRRIARICG